MNWRAMILLMLLISFASCATTQGGAYIEPIPYQEHISQQEYESVKETATYRNYKKLSEWVATVWQANN